MIVHLYLNVSFFPSLIRLLGYLSMLNLHLHEGKKLGYDLWHVLAHTKIFFSFLYCMHIGFTCDSSSYMDVIWFSFSIWVLGWGVGVVFVQDLRQISFHCSTKSIISSLKLPSSTIQGSLLDRYVIPFHYSHLHLNKLVLMFNKLFCCSSNFSSSVLGQFNDWFCETSFCKRFYHLIDLWVSIVSL